MGVIKGPPKNKLVDHGEERGERREERGERREERGEENKGAGRRYLFNPENNFNKEGWRRRGRKGKEKRN
jgi:hypothetical protein